MDHNQRDCLKSKTGLQLQPRVTVAPHQWINTTGAVSFLSPE